MSEIFFDTIVQYESQFDKRRKVEREARGKMTRKLIKQGMNNYQIGIRLRAEGFMAPQRDVRLWVEHYRWKMGIGE